MIAPPDAGGPDDVPAGSPRRSAGRARPGGRARGSGVRGLAYTRAVRGAATGGRPRTPAPPPAVRPVPSPPVTPANPPEKEPEFDGIPLRMWVELLDSTDFDDRFRALVAIGWIGPPARSAAPRLVRLMRDPNPHVRLMAA